MTNNRETDRKREEKGDPVERRASNTTGPHLTSSSGEGRPGCLVQAILGDHRELVQAGSEPPVSHHPGHHVIMKGHQMLRKLREEQEKEEGFTLIELLVVVIIIGILAAIAIPVFLNQRTKAWDSAAKSDVKNMSTAQETYLTDKNVYTTKITDGATDNATLDSLEDVGFSESSGVLHVACVNAGKGYVVVARHENSTNYFYFDSATGQLASVPGGTTVGTSGQSCTVAVNGVA